MKYMNLDQSALPASACKRKRASAAQVRPQRKRKNRNEAELLSEGSTQSSAEDCSSQSPPTSARRSDRTLAACKLPGAAPHVGIADHLSPNRCTWTDIFAVRSHLSRLFRRKTSRKEEPFLATLNGLRVVSMLLVFIGHAAVMRAGHSEAEQVNTIFHKHFSGTWLGSLAFAGLFCVDTFFFIGGFLLTWQLRPYLQMKATAKARIVIALKACVHRFCRIWPSLLVSVALVTALEQVGHSEQPIVKAFLSENQRELMRAGASGYNRGGCTSHWYQVISLFGNLWNQQLDCGLWLWYLSNDFQFFLYGLFLQVLPVKCFRPALKVSGTLFLLLSVLHAIKLPFKPLVQWLVDIPLGPIGKPAYDCLSCEWLDWIRMYYVKPWNRIAIYLVGMWYADVALASKEERPWSMKRSLGLAAPCLAIVTVGPMLLRKSHTSGALWTATSKPLWGIFLGESLLAAPGLVRRVFGAAVLEPLAKLSFGFYLYHPVAIWLTLVWRLHKPDSSNYLNMWEWFVGLATPLLLGLGAAIANWLLVEVPTTMLLQRPGCSRAKVASD